MGYVRACAAVGSRGLGEQSNQREGVGARAFGDVALGLGPARDRKQELG